MGPPGGALRECQPGSPRVPYRRMSNSVHHAKACVGSTRGQRDPLQLAEHSGDAVGIVPASVLARIETFSNLPVINFFFTVIKTKDQLFLRGIWADKMRNKAHKLAVHVFRY